MENNLEYPYIISVVSGKGGVGKTRISVVLAKILSKKYNVLLIDFDLHNQGLTHLLESDDKKTDLSINNYITNNKFVMPTEIYKNVYFISASKMDSMAISNDIEIINNKFSASDFTKILSKVIHESIRDVKIDFVIIDNTGIPDDFSIGSALLANRILLITQTDSVTWRGALNFYGIFENSGGDPLKINFIVNNIPKRYSYDLVNMEVNKVSEIFKNMGFTIFIPFEYGILESFDKNPFEDLDIARSQFYQKIKLLSALIIKESGRVTSNDSETTIIVNDRNNINMSLNTMLDRSPESLKQLYFVKIFQTFFAAMLGFFGILILSSVYPDIIPSVLRNIDYTEIIKTVSALGLIVCSLIVLLASTGTFEKFIKGFARK